MKKKRMVVAAILVLVVGMAIYFLSQGGLKSREEKTAEELFPKVEGMGSIPDLKYIEPDEAKGKLQVSAQVNKEHWERLGALSVEVKVENISNQELLSTVVIYTLFDKSDKVIGSRNAYGVGSVITHVKLGGTGTADLSMIVVANAENISRMEYSLKEILFAEESAPAPAEKPDPKPTEQKTYSALNYPQNPTTPEEVIVAFYGLINDGKYEKALMLTVGAEEVTQEQIKAMAAELKYAIDNRWFRGRKLERVTLSNPIKTVDNSREFISFDVVLHFTNGTTEMPKFGDSLIKINGIWKIRWNW